MGSRLLPLPSKIHQELWRFENAIAQCAVVGVRQEPVVIDPSTIIATMILLAPGLQWSNYSDPTGLLSLFLFLSLSLPILSLALLSLHSFWLFLFSFFLCILSLFSSLLQFSPLLSICWAVLVKVSAASWSEPLVSGKQNTTQIYRENILTGPLNMSNQVLKYVEIVISTC